MGVEVKIEKAKIEDYQKYLSEKSRPPSKGGNTKALHSQYAAKKTARSLAVNRGIPQTCSYSSGDRI